MPLVEKPAVSTASLHCVAKKNRCARRESIPTLPARVLLTMLIGQSYDRSRPNEIRKTILPHISSQNFIKISGVYSEMKQVMKINSKPAHTVSLNELLFS